MHLAVRHPLGVILGILPFNYPLILSVKKLAFALAAGNSFILKPSPHTPAVCLLLGEVLHEAGLPAGVLNVVPVADESLSAVLAQDKRVRMVSFTGGGNAGRKIAMAAAQDFKRTAMELGGKNPLLAFPIPSTSLALSDLLQFIWLTGLLIRSATSSLRGATLKY